MVGNKTSDVEDGIESLDTDKQAPSIEERRANSTLDEKFEAEKDADVVQGLRELDLDYGMQRVHLRAHWWQIWIPKDPPPPPPRYLDEAPMTPLATASSLSKLIYTWITPIMVLGYQRTLQASDLWQVDPSREAGVLSDHLDAAWARRVREAAEWNAGLDDGSVKPGMYKRINWSIRAAFGRVFNRSSMDAEDTSYTARRAAYEQRWRDVDARAEPSLARALNDVLGMPFWLGGIFKIVADISQLMWPVIAREIITFASERSVAQAKGEKGPSMGRGVGMSIAIFIVIITTSVCTHQFFWRSMSAGVLARAALINSIYKRAVVFNGKSRTQIPNSAVVNHISTDVSRIDYCAQWFHATWVAPIQISVCLMILCIQLGPSALAGFSLFVMITPLQERMMTYQAVARRVIVKWTDQRAKAIAEILGSMRIVKYFCYETPFLKRIAQVREKELEGVRKVQNARSANIAVSFSIPVLSAAVAFVTYTSVNTTFEPAIVFSSLSLFQLLRQPMMFLPRSLSSISDALNAVQRLQTIFHAELMPGAPFEIVPDQKLALDARDVSFEWETVARPADASDKEKQGHQQKAADANVDVDVDVDQLGVERAPFTVKNVTVQVARGSVVAIVGNVGSGKSSLLQGLIGEMRKTGGEISFGSNVAYCPQTAWVQNATLRENVVFGQAFDADRYWEVLEDACLLPDLKILPDGDLTEIGEGGINISGGQKQRINIARAMYSNASVLLMDDPLSAVDAHVGRSLFHGAIMKMRQQGRTVILVTHALHFLSHCDYIYTLNNGRVSEEGTYVELTARPDGDFARLDREFGGSEQPPEEGYDAAAQHAREAMRKQADQRAAVTGTGKLEGKLIVSEKRTTGSVGWKIYWEYFVSGRGLILSFPICLSLLLMVGSNLVASLVLVWWKEEWAFGFRFYVLVFNHLITSKFNQPFSFYQPLYAGLNVSQAIWTLLLGVFMDMLTFYASRNLHYEALLKVLYSKISFSDTTPIGRIQGIFGKDIDIIDDQMPVSLRMFILVMSNLVGSIVIITVMEYYFIVVAVVLLAGFWYFVEFYRAGAREVKRLDSMLRSVLYSHFSESLNGLSTIRSFGQIPRFINENEFYIDLEDRALMLTVTTQRCPFSSYSSVLQPNWYCRWLAIRVDMLGGLMVFCIAIMAVIGVHGISDSEIGLVLTYGTTLVQFCSMVTRQSAEIENYMNAVERVVIYAKDDQIEQEAPHEIPDRKPPPKWPSHGAIVFNDVKMAYRPGLPNVLHGITANIRGGEKIGIVGRTGSGKSSLTQALLRIVEYSGLITIDGVDISKIGLNDLRSRVSIIPQDPILFSGTVRTALDPFSMYDDQRLWNAMHRSCLVPTPDSDAPQDENRIMLDTQLEANGANLSLGQRSLLSMARALVKDSRLVVLDEATASVDLETDNQIQATIQSEFEDRTLLCIAHRLRTIVSYDRILVLDSGNIVEFDSPLNLFKKEDSLFRGLCEKSNITLQEIEENISKSQALRSG
ncbi:P-loop containing nucleoside triphosphate hydrolase protein [Fistulina hepatica ATCC 64428]|uniref:p-loop containing nucleoside triphosphate hydrolase protein n=1 Tax=Fistulina hepatica ATCC 64428 TaxID=1128425 RepID=A0A0D7ALZ5_9AGAR|nr:P-loop containing nucleoside triphosphate hydrolase protein [Fistulina hepatica ATCC 64428]